MVELGGPGVGGQALLAQHRELLAVIERIEQLGRSCDSTVGDSWRDEVAALLSSLMQTLESHFQVERESVQNDFDDAPELRAAFMKLDEEHPRILDRFSVAQEAIRDRKPQPKVQGAIEDAVSAFRHHEAQEDELFDQQAD